MNQHNVIFGVIHGVENLVGAQANIHVMQYGADHGYGEVGFQVAMAVPIHYRHGITGTDTGFFQCIGQACDALVQGQIVITRDIAVDDFTVREITHTR